MKTEYGTNITFEVDFLLHNMMGPNCLRLVEELTQKIAWPSSSMRVLDLGCGTGLTSIFLAKEYNAQVFAVDLWINPSENFERIIQFGLEDKIIPIYAEAHELPFARNYFDAVISIDSFHYYGADADYLDTCLIPLVKENGVIAVSVPGLKKDFFNDEVPPELQPFWVENMNMYSMQWWKTLWEKSPNITSVECFSHVCHEAAWNEWLQCSNPYALRDVEMMKAEQGRYFDTIGMITKKKPCG